MRALRYGFFVLGAAVVLAGMAPMANAFHSGGVAECIGCHSMHSPNPNGSFLLTGSDESSTCLNCHEGSPGSYHISTPEASIPAGVPPSQLTPGGDFSWIKKTYNWSPPWGGLFTEEGDTHGHNIIADDFNYAVDGNNPTSPGGNFPSVRLGCESCHDPHGRARRLEDQSIAPTGAPIIASGSYNNSPLPGPGEAVGVYRLLASNGYTAAPAIYTGAPAAAVPSSYNRSEQATQTRTAYGFGAANGYIGWATWCGTCHGDFHSSTNYVHPTDETLGGSVSDNYNFYIETGDLGGSGTTSFLSLVPFAQSTTDFPTLAAAANNDDSNLIGPGSGDRVSCFSCHRAHASGFEYALRWNPESEFLTYNGLWPGTDNGSPPQFARGRTEAEMQQAYYDRLSTTFATYQRSLCNKCHAND